MSSNETPNVIWRPVGKAEKIPTIIGRPVRDAWLGEEIATLSVGFTSNLFSALRDMAEAARERRKSLPIQSLRAIIGHEFIELISLESDLGLDVERRAGAGSAISLFDSDQDLSTMKARVLSCVKGWIADYLVSWEERHELGEFSTRVLKACTEDCIHLHRANRSLKRATGDLDYDLALRVIAERLDGEELFRGVGGCVLRAPVERSNTVQLLTPPFLLESRRVSMRANITLSTVPFTKTTYVLVSATKVNWADRMPTTRLAAGFKATAYVFAPDRHVLPIGIQRERNTGWEFDDGYDAARVKSKNALPSSLEEALKLSAPEAGTRDMSTWWVGLPQTTRLYAGVGHRTVLEVDEFDLLKEVQNRCAGMLEEHARMRSAQTRWKRATTSVRMMSPDDLNISVGGADDLLDGDNPKPTRPAPAGERMAASRMQLRDALQRIHHGQRPKVWIFCDGKRETDLIKQALDVMFGDALLVDANPIPSGTHGLLKELPLQTGTEAQRLEARVLKWQEQVRANAKYAGPKFALICAPDVVGGEAEDRVNYYAGIKALCGMGFNVHHVLPIGGEGQQHLESFVHRLQSALMDVLFAHYGVVLGLDSFVSSTLDEQLPNYIHGLQIVDARARPFTGEQDVIFVLQTRLAVRTGITEARYAYNVAGRVSPTDWMPLAEATRWLAAKGRIGDGKRSWLRDGFEPIVRAWLDDVQLTDPYGIALVDWQSVGGKIRSWSDGSLNKDGPFKIDGIPLTRAYPNLTIARIRRGEFTMAVRAISRQRFEAHVEAKRAESSRHARTEEYLTSTKVLVELLPGPSAEGSPRNAHFVATMGYSMNPGFPRGLSCYRSVERFRPIDDKDDDEPADPDTHERDFNLEQAGACTKDCSVPSPQDITILSCPEGSNAALYAKLIMGLRVGYMHYNRWTTLPAPLFFISKVRDHVMRFDGPEWVPEVPDELVDQEVEPERSTLADVLLSGACDRSTEKPTHQEPSAALVSEWSKKDEVPTSTRRDTGAWRRHGKMPRLFLDHRNLYREMLQRKVRVDVELPYFATQHALFPFDSPDRRSVHRAWMRLRRSFSVRHTDRDPSPGQFYCRLYQMLRVPQAGFRLLDAQHAVTFTDFFAPIDNMLKRALRKWPDRGIAKMPYDDQVQIITDLANSEQRDEDFAWLYFVAAQSPSSVLESALDRLDIGELGPATSAAIEYWNRCSEAVNAIIQARADHKLNKGQWSYPVPKTEARKERVNTTIQGISDGPRNESCDQEGESKADPAANLTADPGTGAIQHEAISLINRLVPGDVNYEQVKAELQSLIQRFDVLHAEWLAQVAKDAELAVLLAELRADLRRVVDRYRGHPLSADGTLRPVVESLEDPISADGFADIRDRITAIANALTELDAAYAHYKQAELRESESGLSLLVKRRLRQETTDMLAKVEASACNLETEISTPPPVLRYQTHCASVELAKTDGDAGVDRPSVPALSDIATTDAVMAVRSPKVPPLTLVQVEPICAVPVTTLPVEEQQKDDPPQPRRESATNQTLEESDGDNDQTESDIEVSDQDVDDSTPAVRYLGEEERAGAHKALLHLTEKRRYGLASITADALCYALEGEGYATHRSVLHAMFDSLDAVDCRLVTDVRSSEELIAMDFEAATCPECQPEYFAMGVFAALMPNLLFDEAAQRYRTRVTQFLGQRFQEIPPLQSLIQSVAEIDYGRGILTRERCMAIHVDVKQAIGATLEQMKKRARSWLSDGEMRTLERHRGVNRINNALFGKEGVLGRAIDMISCGDAKRVEQLYNEQIQKIKNKPGAHIEETARRLKEKNTPDGKFRQFLVQNIEATVGFVEEFIRLLRENEGKQRAVLADQQSFLESIYKDCDASIAALGEQSPSKPIERVYANGAKIALKALMRIFHSDMTQTCLAVPDQRLLIQLPMDVDLMPQFTGEDALCTISEVIGETARLADEDLGDLDGIDENVLRERMEDALSKHMEEKRFYPANCIAERYGLVKKVGREHLEALRMLEREVRDINYEVQHAYLLSAIDPSLGNQLQRILEKVRSGIDEQNINRSIGGHSPSAGGYVDIPHANHALTTQVRDVLNGRLNVERDKLSRWLDDFEERNTELKQEVDEIRAMMTKGQKAGALRTALDAFNTLKSDRKLPRGSSDRLRVAETYQQFVNCIHQFGTGGHQAFLEQFRSNLANPPSPDDPEWLKPLDESTRKSALDFLRTWVDVCSIRSTPSENANKTVEAFFDAMECPSMPSRRMGGQPSHQAVYYWDVSPFKGLPETFVPPELGSQCSILEAVIMSGGRTNTDIRRLVGQGGTVPRIIFVRTSLSLEDRAEVSQDGPVLLLDDYLAIYIALRPHQRLKAFVEVALLTFRAHPYKDYENGSVPFEMFYGREAERERLNRVSGAAVLYGGRRLGKTSLFGRVLHDHEKSVDIGNFAVMVSLLDVAPDDHAPLNAWKKIYEKLNANRPIRLVGDIHGRPDKYEDYVSHIRAELIKDGSKVKSLYLLIDEADKVMQRELTLGSSSRPSFVRSLSALVDNLKGIIQLRYCVAGLHNLTRMTNEENSPLGKVETIALEPYNTSEDRTRGFSLITQPLEALGFVFEDRMMPWHIMSVCNFYPAFIQMYCMRLLDCLYNARQGLCPPLKITHRHLENTERDQQLLGLLREKFKYNLDLDKRYMAIALLLADRFYSESGSSQMEYGLNTTSVRELCKTMFPGHFKMTNEGAYEALLNEMVKLNILDHHQGRYVLRNPHIAMMIGDEHAVRMRMDELETMTPEEARSPGERRIRAVSERGSDVPPVLFPMPQGWIRNVMDAVGPSKLTAAPMPIIINHRVSGFDHFVRDGNAAWKLFGGDLNLEFSRPASPQDILQKEKALRWSAARHSRKTLLVVEQKRNLRLEQADEYAEVSKRLQKHGIQLVLLLPLDLAVEAAKRMTKGWMPPAAWGIQRVPTWSDDGIYYYLGENIAVADNTPSRQELLRATGGYGEIIEAFRVEKIRPTEVQSLAGRIKAHYAPTLQNLLRVFGVPEGLCGDRGAHIRDSLVLLHECQFDHDILDSIVSASDGIERWEYDVMSWLDFVRVDETNRWVVPDLYRLAPSP